MSTYIFINNIINYTNCSHKVIYANNNPEQPINGDNIQHSNSFNAVYDPDKDLKILELEARLEKSVKEVMLLKEKQIDGKEDELSFF